MTKYWINIDGVQSGPLSAEQVQEHNPGPDCYVWHNGLSDWVLITEVPELATLIQKSNLPAEADEISPLPSDMPPLPPHKTVAPPIPMQRVTPMPIHTLAPEQTKIDEPMKPVRAPFGEAIVTLILCIPIGIVALWLAFQARTAIKSDDFVTAQRYNNAVSWMCIISAVWATIFLPMALIKALL